MENNISIMVVDNDPEIIKSAWRALTYEGHVVEGMLNGKEAIHKIKQNNYDLVFTDLALRGIESITLIKWIKKFRPSTGIVGITDYRSHQTVKEAHSLGIISHMLKPFTAGMLRDVTNKAIERINGTVSMTETDEDFHPEKLAELDEVINQYGKTSSHAIRVLLHAQEIFGYLPPVIQTRIAQGLNMYPSEIRSLVSYYSCFRMKPEGGHAPCYISGYERAWNSVTWMTGSKALHAVNEFIKGRQLEY